MSSGSARRGSQDVRRGTCGSKTQSTRKWCVGILASRVLHAHPERGSCIKRHGLVRCVEDVAPRATMICKKLCPWLWLGCGLRECAPPAWPPGIRRALRGALTPRGNTTARASSRLPKMIAADAQVILVQFKLVLSRLLSLVTFSLAIGISIFIVMALVVLVVIIISLFLVIIKVFVDY